MTFLKLSEIIHEGQSCLPTFSHLFILLSRVHEPKTSEDITTNFGSGTLDNNISKWPKVGRSLYDFWQFQKSHFVICLLYGGDRLITNGVKQDLYKDLW